MNETMTDRELDAWLAEHLFKTLTHEQDGTWGYSPICGDYRYAWSEPSIFNIPAYSSTGEGMLMVIEEMRERGFWYESHNYDEGRGDGVIFRVSFENTPAQVRRTAYAVSLPRAVAEAARAAIEAEA